MCARRPPISAERHAAEAQYRTLRLEVLEREDVIHLDLIVHVDALDVKSCRHDPGRTG